LKWCTRGQFTQEYESELIHNDRGSVAPVFEEFRIEPGFEYGIGLYATMDAPTITVDALESMIAKFRAMGEKPWKSEAPVPHERLPRDTFINLAKAQKLVNFMDSSTMAKSDAPDLSLEQINALVHELRP
jgi:hypothetical protein